MSAQALSLLGILLATALFIVAIFKGYHVTLVSIVAVVVVSVFSQLNIVTAMTDPYISKVAGVYKAYFLIFFLSALFAKILGDTGAASSIAFKLARLAKMWKGHEKLGAVLCLGIIQACFTMGGISLFVVTFTVLYIAKDLFTELDVPWKLYTCASFGSSTVTAGILPGTPQLTNLIPMKFFGTTATAAPVLSIVCSIFCLVLCFLWIRHQVNASVKKGEGFAPSGDDLMKSWDSSKDAQRVELPLWMCLLPSIVLLICLNFVKIGAEASLAAGCIAGLILFAINPETRSKINLKAESLTAVSNCNTAIVALASAAGFGGVVAAVPGFQFILGGLNNIPGPKVLQVIVAVNVAAGFSASSSTGLTLALGMLGERFMAMGIPAAALHRLCSISSLGLDTLPHSSALANTFSMCHLKYSESYINNFMLSVVITIATAVFCAILISCGLTF